MNDKAKVISELETYWWKVQLRFLVWANALNKLRPFREREKKKTNTYTYNSKIRLANGSSRIDRDEDFLPRTDFHQRSDRPIGNENLWITRGPRAEIKSRQSAARAPLGAIHEWPSVRLIQATREISFSQVPATRDRPPLVLLPLSYLSISIRFRAREINSRSVNYIAI